MLKLIMDIPPAWMIEEIEKLKRQQEIDNRPSIEIGLHDFPFPTSNDSGVQEEKETVIIIHL